MLAQETEPLDKLVESSKKILGRITGGFTTSLTTTLTDELSKKIVKDAEPIVRNLVTEERNRAADAALRGVPFLAGGAFVAIGTTFLVPKERLIFKVLGYAASSALLGFGAYSVLSKISTKAAPPAPAPAAPAPAAPTQPAPQPPAAPAPSLPSLPSLPGIDTAALKAEMSVKIVKDAEPFIRALVQEERSRLGSALESAIPFHIAAALGFVGTLFLVPQDKPVFKAAGYSVATALTGIGFWRTFSQMQSAR